MPSLEHLIERREARLAVVGLGYVGLPLAVEFAAAGFPVSGIDVDPDRVAAVNDGRSHIGDVASGRVHDLVRQGRLSATSSWDAAAGADAIAVCVPTPFNRNKEPDLSAMTAAAAEIAARSRPGQLVVLESTTYPGTTEEIFLPPLAARGLRPGRDVFLAYSPERVDPGNRVFGIANTPKVVGGVTPRCGALAARLYGAIVQRVVPVSSCRVAEMAKLLENIFRNVNIALVNEMAMLCDRMGIDVWEVVEAAATKPFGFMSFQPGPGVGGHCIPVDPVYLSWKAREFDFFTNFVNLAAEVNANMPYFVAQKTVRALTRRGVPILGARILILGVAFKPGVPDVRNSPAVRLADILAEDGAVVAYHDPHVPALETATGVYKSIDLTPEELNHADCVVIHTDHREYDWARIVPDCRLVLDTRNATRHVDDRRQVVVRL